MFLSILCKRSTLYRHPTTYTLNTIRTMAEAVRTTLSQNLTGAAHDLAPDHAKFSLDDVPDQSNKVAVVTGGSEGIGYACTHTLLKNNIAKLFFLSVDKEVADSTRDTIREEMSEDMYTKIHWIQCDMSNWQRVVEAAEEIKQGTDRLDILINNAARGIMTFQLTGPEGGEVDRHMSVNHFGHVILTSHLLPLMKKTAKEFGGKVRISNQASNAHQNAPGEVKFASLEELNTDLGPMGLYGRSKLANILYSRYLARHLKEEGEGNVLVNATHPGVVETKMSTVDIHEPYPRAGYLMSTVLKPFKKDIFEGCTPSMYAATATERSGEYICPPAQAEAGSELAQSEELGEQLMKLTREVVTEKTRGESVDKGCPMKDY